MKRSKKKHLEREQHMTAAGARLDEALTSTRADVEAPAEKRPVFAVRPCDSTSRQELADSMADGLIEHINADRARRGLPPMPKE